MSKRLIVKLITVLAVSSVITTSVIANEVVENKIIISEDIKNNQEEYTETKAKAQELAEALVDKYGTASIQYAIMKDGETIVSDAYTNKAYEAISKSNTDTLYGIGSVSKMYTTASVMKLVEQGKVNLDEPVTAYLPEFKMADERYKDITVRMLLNHSSGLMGSSFEDAFLFEDVDSYAKDSLLNKLQTQRLKADPGEYSVYCNDGFALAEIIVERVSGLSFTQFINTNFREELGLDKITTPENISSWEGFANTYKPGTLEAYPVETVNVIGTGGIYSNAEDLCKFGEIFTKDSKLLKEETKKAVGINEAIKGIWPDSESTNMDYGLGWDSVSAAPFNEYGISAYMKGGDTINYHASMIVLPDNNMTAVVLSSGGASTFNQMMGSEILLSALKESGEISEIKEVEPIVPVVEQPLEMNLDKYTGLYTALSSMYEVKMEENKLRLINTQQPGVMDQIFTHVGEGVFKSPDGAVSLKFVEESNGKTYIQADKIIRLPEVGEVRTCNYELQQVPKKQIEPKVLEAWEKRHGKLYYVVNDKYTSVGYTGIVPVVPIVLNEATPGYMAGFEIIDENKALGIGEIPGMMGRDLSDISFYKQDDTEYMKYGDLIAIEDSAIEGIAKGKAVCTISQSGDARWYKVGNNLGKEISINTPVNGSVAIYGDNGNCLVYKTKGEILETTLQPNSTIVFMGDAGTVFETNIY